MSSCLSVGLRHEFSQGIQIFYCLLDFLWTVQASVPFLCLHNSLIRLTVSFICWTAIESQTIGSGPPSDQVRIYTGYHVSFIKR